MRLPHDTFTALGQALPGAVIGGEDARPVLPPVIHKAITLPGIVLPVLANSLDVRAGSNYSSLNLTRAESLGSVAENILNLSSGLWRLSGHLMNRAGLSDTALAESIAFIQGGVTNSFVRVSRNTIPIAVRFDFNVLFRDTAGLFVLWDATGVGQDIRLLYSLCCERLL